MHRSLLTTPDSASLDERLVRCAEHNTAFYTTFPRDWDIGRVLRALAERFRQQGHQHVPFETIDLTCAPVAARATGLPARRAAGTETPRLRRPSRRHRSAAGRLAWRAR